MKLILEFARNDAGLETVEYAIMAGLVVGASVAIIVAIGAWVKTTYSTLQTALP